MLAVKVVLGVLAVAITLPILLLLAVALGPVILGLLCAALFGLIVFALWSLLAALGLAGRSWERSRRARASSKRAGEPL